MLRKANSKVNHMVFFVIAIALLLGSAALAAPEVRQIEALYSNIKVFIDGKEAILTDIDGKTVEPFIMNGIIYIPIQPFCEAMGKVTEWEGATSTVYVGPHNSQKPSVMLSQMDYINRAGPGYRNDYFTNMGKVYDNFGNEYSNGICTASENCWQEYVLNAQYTRMTGTFFLNYKFRSVSVGGYFKVYGDGQLLYTSKTMTPGTEPEDFEVDLRGVLRMTVEMVKCGDTGMGSIERWWDYYNIIANAALYQ